MIEGSVWIYTELQGYRKQSNISEIYDGCRQCRIYTEIQLIRIIEGSKGILKTQDGEDS